jgi:hypothetical protein
MDYDISKTYVSQSYNNGLHYFYDSYATLRGKLLFKFQAAIGLPRCF